MIANNKQKIMLGIPLACVLGMGSYWFVLRDTGPKTGPVVNAEPVQKQSRHPDKEEIDKPRRGKRTKDSTEPARVERPERKRPEREEHKRDRQPKPKPEIHKIEEKQPPRG